MTNNQSVKAWLDDMVAMCKPDEIVWIDGSEEQLEALRAEACATGEMIKLNQEKLPGCYYHRTAENDVARVEDRTFICTETKEESYISGYNTETYIAGYVTKKYQVGTSKVQTGTRQVKRNGKIVNEPVFEDRPIYQTKEEPVYKTKEIKLTKIRQLKKEFLYTYRLLFFCKSFYM